MFVLTLVFLKNDQSLYRLFLLYIIERIYVNAISSINDLQFKDNKLN